MKKLTSQNLSKINGGIVGRALGAYAKALEPGRFKGAAIRVFISNNGGGEVATPMP